MFFGKKKSKDNSDIFFLMTSLMTLDDAQKDKEADKERDKMEFQLYSERAPDVQEQNLLTTLS